MGGWCALLCNCLRSSYPPLHSWPLSHIQCLPACILCLCGGRYGKIVDVELQWESAAEFQAGAAAALGMPGACAAVCNAWPRLAWPPSQHSKHRAPSSLLPTGGAPSCLACLLLQWGLMMFSPGGGCKGSLLKAQQHCERWAPAAAAATAASAGHVASPHCCSHCAAAAGGARADRSPQAHAAVPHHMILQYTSDWPNRWASLPA